MFIIDISTFVLTVISTAVVRKGIATKEMEKEKNVTFLESMKEGWRAITDRKGIFILIMISFIN